MSFYPHLIYPLDEFGLCGKRWVCFFTCKRLVFIKMNINVLLMYTKFVLSQWLAFQSASFFFFNFIFLQIIISYYCVPETELSTGNRRGNPKQICSLPLWCLQFSRGESNTVQAIRPMISWFHCDFTLRYLWFFKCVLLYYQKLGIIWTLFSLLVYPVHSHSSSLSSIPSIF